MPDLPETFGQVHDLLQSMFGIGSYDDVARSQPPYFKARIDEIGRIKAIAKRRRVSPEQLGIAAWYARRTGVHVRQALRLFPLIPEAQREWNRVVAEQRQADLQHALNDLIEEALLCGEGEWAERFIRATPAEVPTLTEKWRTR
jgi:hypothetical protein